MQLCNVLCVCDTRSRHRHVGSNIATVPGVVRLVPHAFGLSTTRPDHRSFVPSLSLSEIQKKSCFVGLRRHVLLQPHSLAVGLYDVSTAESLWLLVTAHSLSPFDVGQSQLVEHPDGRLLVHQSNRFRCTSSTSTTQFFS